MPNEVIDRVHAMARRNNAPNELTFADRNGTPETDHRGQ